MYINKERLSGYPSSATWIFSQRGNLDMLEAHGDLHISKAQGNRRRIDL